MDGWVVAYTGEEVSIYDRSTGTAEMVFVRQIGTLGSLKGAEWNFTANLNEATGYRNKFEAEGALSNCYQFMKKNRYKDFLFRDFRILNPEDVTVLGIMQS